MQEQERLLWIKNPNILTPIRTPMVCCSGQCLKPMFIFEKQNWPSGPYFRNGVEGTLDGKSPNGDIDEELFIRDVQ